MRERELHGEKEESKRERKRDRKTDRKTEIERERLKNSRGFPKYIFNDILNYLIMKSRMKFSGKEMPINFILKH